MWQRATWRAFTEIGPSPAFAALDETAKTKMKNYPATVQSIETLTLPNAIPAISQADWQAFYRGVLSFVQAESTEQEFLALVDMFDQLPASRRKQRQTAFRANIDAARDIVGVFELQKMVTSAGERTLQRLEELLTHSAAVPELPKITCNSG
jgi:hypothetical protein